MDAFAVISLIGLIVSVISGINQTAGVAMTQNQSNKITKEAQAILKGLADDAALIQKLLNAANKKDVHLARSLLYSSPMGNRVKKLEKEYGKNVDVIRKYNDQLIDKQEEITNTQNKVNQDLSEVPNTGSAIGNLIMGASKDPQKNADGITTTNIHLTQPKIKHNPNVL